MPSAKYTALMGLLGKGFDSGAEGATKAINQKSDNDAKLAQLLQGQHNKTDEDLRLSDAMNQRAMDMRNQLQNGHPGHKYNVSMGGNGTVSIGESDADPLARLIPTQTKELSDRIQKAGIPALQAQSDIIQKDVDSNGGKLRSVGPVANYVPDSLVPFAESVGKFTHGMVGMPNGSTQERQDIAALRNAAMHTQFGSRQTEAEKSMLADQLGLHGGNTQENVQHAIKGLSDVADKESQNITAGFDPAAVALYQGRGGRQTVGFQGNKGGSGQTAQPPSGGASGSANAGQYEPDVLQYAKTHRVTPDQAAAIKKLRTGQ